MCRCCSFVAVKFYLVLTCYQIKSFCTDAHRLTMKAMSQGYCTIMGLIECIRFNKLKQKKSDTHIILFRGQTGGYTSGGYAETK